MLTYYPWLQASAFVLAYLLFCVGCYRRYQRRQPALSSVSELDWLVAYASQSGQAHALAEQHTQQLREAGLRSQLLTLNQLDGEWLQRSTRLLLIVSTYGEGDPPDNGRFFLRHARQLNALPSLQFAVLGLGDRHYAHFCAYAEQVFQTFVSLGAKAYRPLHTIDQLHTEQLNHWYASWHDWLVAEGQAHGDNIERPTSNRALSNPTYHPWRLTERQCVNEKAGENFSYLLTLRSSIPEQQALTWQAGDIAQVQVSDHQPSRDYTIASVPEEGHLQLFVRERRNEHGTLGLASGYLCQHAGMGDSVAIAIRRNPSFHPVNDDSPLILIGNGTGLAGLRAHLMHRWLRGANANWLIYGERDVRFDRPYQEELAHWCDSGHITRLDWVFSRSETLPAGDSRQYYHHGYVQQTMLQQADTLHEWLAKGAVIFVCGSRDGMAAGVDDVLLEQLGAEEVEQLLAAGRYCRDVY